MSNLARKYEHGHLTRPKKKKKLHRKRRLFTKGEKFLYILAVVMISFLSVHILSKQAQIYKVNKEIQTMEKQIQEERKVTEDLQARVNELTEYHRVMETAKKQGRSINENNVKVVNQK